MYYPFINTAAIITLKIDQPSQLDSLRDIPFSLINQPSLIARFVIVILSKTANNFTRFAWLQKFHSLGGVEKVWVFSN